MQSSPLSIGLAIASLCFTLRARADEAPGPGAIEDEAPNEASREAPPVMCPAELDAALCAIHTRDEDERVGALMASLRGSSLRQRIIAYEAYVRAYPNSRHAAVLYEEAAELRKWLARRIEIEPVPLDDQPIAARSLSLPTRAEPGAPLEIVIETTGKVDTLTLELRGPGDSYEDRPMRRLGSSHFGYRFSGDEMHEPGVAFYVEARLSDGTKRPIAGDAARPYTIIVDEPTSLAEPEVEAALLGEYLDYNRLRGDDWAFRLEGDFGLRFRDLGLRAVRGGFGVVRGESGLVDDLDDAGVAPDAFGLTAVHLEVEAGLDPYFALVLRGIGGAVTTTTLDAHGTGGGRLMGRIGRDLDTNLLIGAEYIAGYGALGMANLELAVFERVPLSARFEIGNQPLGELTLRGVAQVGYRVVDELELNARFSYQGRSDAHTGPGFGAGARARW